MNSLDDKDTAVVALKYMLMCKIMCGQAEDVGALISSKGGLQHQGEALDAMKAVSEAYKARSLKDLQRVLRGYDSQLGDDPIIAAHLGSLQDSLMEENVKRLIEPFSRVEIAHVAHLIELPIADVEMKLSQMILDRKFEGILDQGTGCLIVYDDPAPETAREPRSTSSPTSLASSTRSRLDRPISSPSASTTSPTTRPSRVTRITPLGAFPNTPLSTRRARHSEKAQASKNLARDDVAPRL